MSFSKLPCGLMVSEENSRFDVLGSNPTILKVLFLSFFPRHLVVCLFFSLYRDEYACTCTDMITRKCPIYQ